jgi:hypothetical protein
MAETDHTNAFDSPSGDHFALLVVEHMNFPALSMLRAGTTVDRVQSLHRISLERE